MVGSSRKSRLVRIAASLGVLLWMLAGAGAPAVAAAKKKPAAPKPPSMADLAPGLPVFELKPPVARFFTINQVLARRDGRPADDSMRLAALDPSSPTATDASVGVAGRLPGVGPEKDQPFGLVTFRAPEGLLWVKWRRLQTEVDAEMALLARCTEAVCDDATLTRFKALVTTLRSQSGRARIEAVNRAVNAAIRYTSDVAQHGVPDRWTAPLASLSSGLGDCEDYAIAKYVALKAAGTSEQDLRILLVKDRAVRQDHAVLAVRLDGRWLVLDNRHLALTPDNELNHFTPLFALDQHGVNLFAAPYAEQPSRADPAPAAQDADLDPGWTGSIRRGLPRDVLRLPDLRMM